MKNFALLAFLSVIILSQTGCLKSKGSCNPRSPQSEEASILAYASANNITGTLHPSGIYYEIVSQGTGLSPNSNSQVRVNYTGKLLNGTIFDSGTNAGPWMLGGLIPGWQIALPLIQEGGTIKMIVPSSLAYGCNGTGPIPANAVLFFQVDLVDVL